MFKKISLGLLFLLIALALWQHELVAYGWMQGKGQFNVLWNARPIAEVMADKTVPDSLKKRLELIGEIKRFAIDSLGLNDTKNYTSLFDQKGKPILWVLTCAEPYKMEAKQWSFPMIGAFTYKGFFDEEKLKLAQKEMKTQGYDTDTNPVSAWSTLGWFRDPILSSMLYRAEGSLANLIIHEMTHATLFVKDSHEFNENLAEFVGDYGAKAFLKHKFGQDSPQMNKYLKRKVFNDKFSKHVLRGAQQLDSLYQNFSPNYSSIQKDSAKYTLIQKIVDTSDSVFVGMPFNKSAYFEPKVLPNNAFFVGFITYRARQNQFEDEFLKQFSGNFRRYLAYLKEKYPSI